jgi:plastocyanin
MMRRSHILFAFVLLLVLDAAVASAGGTIEGKTVFTGKPRRNPLIQMGADPNCQRINEGKKVVQKMVDIQRDRSIDNVFVHVLGDLTAAGAPPEAVVVDQQGCIYHPRVSAGVTGQTLKITNSDPTLHNVHTQSKQGNGFNVGQPKAGMEYAHILKGEEVMLRLKCDVHPWMTGFIGVKKNPYFAVTRAGGGFTIADVPPGTYTVQAWQERLGTVEQEVTVVEGETVTVEFGFGPPGSAANEPAFALPVRELTVPYVEAVATDR